jgi:predicted ATPase
MKRIIISGGPSSGKTTLINNLKSLGYPCFDEISREIISEQQIKKSKKELNFEKIVFDKRIEQYNLAKSKIQFYDRSFIDGIAYMKINNIEIPEYFYQTAKTHKFYSTVFITPFWTEIFENDVQRLETIQEAKKIYSHLKEIYTKIGYEVVILPKDSVKKRIQIILEHI